MITHTRSRRRAALVSLLLLALAVPSVVASGAVAAMPAEVRFDLVLQSGDDDGDVTGVKGATAHLYRSIAGVYTEVDSDVSTPAARLSATYTGDYRLRFSKGGSWLAVQEGYDDASGDVLRSSDACSFDINDASLGHVYDLDLYLAIYDGAPTCGAEGTAGTVSGEVTGIPAGETASANLYSVETYEDFGDTYVEFTWSGATEVKSDGTYSIDGVYSEDEYTVSIDPDAETNHFFSTYYGDYINTYPNEEKIADAAFTLTAGQDTEDRDIAVTGGAFVHGVVRAAGKPLAHAAVSVIQYTDNSVEGYESETDSAGKYSALVPVGASAVIGAYYPGYRAQYFDGVEDPMKATEITPTVAGEYPGSIDFSLVEAPLAVLGVVLKQAGKKYTSYNGVVVYLSRLTDGGWKTTAHRKTSKIAGLSVVEFPKGALAGSDDGLTPGTYRLKFKKNGEWLPLKQSIVSSATMLKISEESCSIRLGKLQRGSVIVAAVIDPKQQRPNCNSTPAGAVAPGGGSVLVGGTGTPLADTPTPAPTTTSTPTPTPTPTATVPVTPTAPATTAPLAAPSGSPSPEPVATGAVEPASSTAYLAGGGVLALLILGAVAFLIFRRRRTA